MTLVQELTGPPLMRWVAATVVFTAEARRKPTRFRGVDEADNWEPIHRAALSRSVISH